MASKNKYKKTKVNPYVISGAIFFVIALVLLIILITPSEQKQIYNSYVSAETSANKLTYRESFKKNVLTKTTIKELEKKIANGDTFILYIGTPTCAACITQVGTYNHFFKEKALTGKILYLDTTSAPSGLEAFLTKYTIETSTPQLLAFSKNKVQLTLAASSNTGVEKFFTDALKLYS